MNKIIYNYFFKLYLIIFIVNKKLNIFLNSIIFYFIYKFRKYFYIYKNINGFFYKRE